MARLAARAARARPDEVDDLEQVVIEKLLTKWDLPHIEAARERGADSWKGYVIQVARNALTDMRRKAGRTVDRERRATAGVDGEPLEQRPGVLRSVAAPDSNVDAYLARLAIIDSLDDAGLTAREQEVLTLILLDGATVKEIAETLSISRRRVRELRQTGQHKLRGLIAGDADVAEN
ncbi:MAG: sigma-70 family RNA polymerase sigma factor [Actinomycetota bacterium]